MRRNISISLAVAVALMVFGPDAWGQDNGGPVVGTGNGLIGTYYNNRHLNGGLGTCQITGPIDFDIAALLGQGVPRPNEFGLVWAGELQAQYSENYTLYLQTEGGGRIWLNEQLVLDDWNCHSNRESSASVNLVAGQHYLIRVEYFQNHGLAQVKLSWSSPSTPKQVIPQSQLYAPATDTDGHGLADLWQLHYFGHLGVDPNADPDGDGLSNLQEYQQHTDPTNPQTYGVPDTMGQGPISGIIGYGSAVLSNAVYTLSAVGADMWGNSDSMYYLYQPMGTNGQVVVRVLGLQATNEFAKASLVLRETLGGLSRHAAMVYKQTNVLAFQWRDQTGRAARAPSSVATNGPCWMKLVRNQDWVGGYYSNDGTNWTLLDWMEFKNLAPQVYVGLAVSAHDIAGLHPVTAEFDQFSVGSAAWADTISVQEGNGDGLAAHYRNDSLLYLPGVTNEVDPEVTFFWRHGPPFPFINPDNYGVCWSGEMQAQFTGPHTISVDTLQEDWVRVWVNEQLVIDGWRNFHADGELQTTMNLVAGQRYLIRVEMYNNHGRGRVELRWSSASMSERTIPQSQLYSQPVDSDGHGLPDLWQLHYFGHLGVDPNADPDGDGLSNLQEYQYHTDPTKADTDGDGMPDAWEITHGLDPQYADDAGMDYNSSGLSSLQDYQLGLDPLNVDSNGDGLPDAFEEQYLNTGSSLNCTNRITVAATVNGAQAVNLLGSWKVDGNDIRCLDRRGGVDLPVTLNNADKYVLNLTGTQSQPNSLETSFKLLLGVDGQTLGHYTLNAGYGTNGVVELVLPYLQAGPHTVHVFWDGVVSFSSLRIKQARLLSVSGQTNQAGIKAWVAQMVANQSGLDNTNPVIGSYVSPVCLEGRELYPMMMQVTNRETNALSPTATSDGRWYVNAHLQATTQTVFQASYQNGALTEARQLQWLPVNFLTASNLVIRQNDSLWFDIASTNKGSLQVMVGTNTYTGKPANGIVSKFTDAGVITVSGTYTPASGSPQSGSLMVTVLAQNELPNVPPAAWVGMERNLDLPNLATGAVLQADTRMICYANGTNANGATRLTMDADANEPRSILVRSGVSGSVIDSTQVQGFDVWSGDQAYTKILQTYPDGSQLVEMLMISSPVNANVTFTIQPIVSGVMFDDGTTLKTLTATNFDALGQYPVRFIRSASVKTSVCNSIQAWQGNYQIGYRH